MDPPKDRPTRRAYLVEELPEEWVEALRNANFDHLGDEPRGREHPSTPEK